MGIRDLALSGVLRNDVLPPPRGTAYTPAAQRTQGQRWAAIFHDVKSMSSAAHHDDSTTEGFSWNRSDAEAILAATAGLLGRYTQQR
jgi:hypothetical protein